MLQLWQDPNEKEKSCSSHNVCTHTSIHKHTHIQSHTHTHKICHSSLCLRMYMTELKQCSFLSKHLIISAGWQHSRESQALPLHTNKTHLENVMLGWKVLTIPAVCVKALCTWMCVIYQINISIYTHTPFSIWTQWTFPQACTWKK